MSKLEDGGGEGYELEDGWKGTIKDKMTQGLIEIEDTIPAM